MAISTDDHKIDMTVFSSVIQTFILDNCDVLAEVTNTDQKFHYTIATKFGDIDIVCGKEPALLYSLKFLFQRPDLVMSIIPGVDRNNGEWSFSLASPNSDKTILDKVAYECVIDCLKKVI